MITLANGEVGRQVALIKAVTEAHTTILERLDTRTERIEQAIEDQRAGINELLALARSGGVFQRAAEQGISEAAVLPICDPNSLPFGPCTPASDSNDPKVAGAAALELQFYPPGLLPICDPNSLPFGPCTPASDSNDPKVAGAAALELQFYPPGKDRTIDPFSCSIDQWCAAVNIFSFHAGGTEQFNFAWIQTDGVPAGHPGPSNHPFPTPNAKTLLLEQGDRIRVTLRDTPDGLLSVVEDLTTGASGFMVASAANGFETVNGSGQAIPFNFRPLYDTATPEHIVSAFARIGVMFAMEIGHNEQVNNDSDDGPCSQGPVVPACYGQDTDYDGTSYIHDWPGLRDFTTATSIKIQSAEGGGIGPLSVSDHRRDYDGAYNRMQFETTANIGNPDCLAAPATCNVHVPFDGMVFYPFYALNEHDIGHRKSVVTVGAGGSKIEEEVCSLLFGDFANSRETNNFGGDAQYGFPDEPRNRLELVSDLQPNPCIPVIDRRRAED